MSDAKDTTQKKGTIKISDREDRPVFVTNTIPEKEFINLRDGQDPTAYLGAWDFYIVFFAIVLRFMVDTERKSQEVQKEKGESFQFEKYLDAKHVRRWLVHILTAFVGLFVLPEVFVVYIYKKYDVGLSDWNLIGSAVVGFLGFDIIRVSEKVFLLILSKTLGYKQDEK